MAGGVAQVNFYATLFRGNRFADAIAEIAPVALRYGASRYSVHRGRDDEYKFLLMNTWESKQDFEAYWYGNEFNHWRAVHSSWYQVPLLYVWADLLVEGGTAENGNSLEATNGVEA